MQEAESSSGRKGASQSGRRGRHGSLARVPRFLIGVLLAVGTAVVAERQHPRPDPYEPVTPPSLDWLRYPIERNAFERLALIRSDLTALFALDRERVWVGGSAGLVAHSEDGGFTWRKQEVKWASAAPQGPRPVELSGASGSLLPLAFAGEAPLYPEDPKRQSNLLARPPASDQRQQTAPGSDAKSLEPLQPDPQSQLGRSPAPTEQKRAEPPKQKAAEVESPAQPGLPAFRAIFFGDRYRGFAVGERGTIIATRDGGESWEAQRSGVDWDLIGVRFAPDGTEGRAFAADGGVLSTRDAGQSWVSAERFLSPESPNPNSSASDRSLRLPLRAMRFEPGGELGCAVDDTGRAFLTADGGGSWKAAGGSQALRSAQFLSDVRRGWAVDEDGSILVTSDGGSTWEPELATFVASLQFLDDGRHGWAVGPAGYILHTADGGTSWSAQTRGVGSAFQSIFFLSDGRSGWAVGSSGGRVSVSSDGGGTWTPERSKPPLPFRSVFFSEDALRGWAVAVPAEGGGIFRTRDGGQWWERLPSSPEAEVLSVVFAADGLAGRAFDPYDRVYSTADGGLGWQKERSGVAPCTFLSVAYAAELRRGFAVCEDGKLLATESGGDVWEPRDAPMALRAAFFLAGGRRGWATTQDGSILSTRDGGRSWTAVGYARWPAPWAWLVAFVAVFGLVLPALRQPDPVEAEKESVADMLSSDRPLRPGDPDPLRFRSTARGLSRFLANENTEPPLTIAVTGEWGTGKSSLMAFVRGDLRRYGFPTVWFNAWHHQTEEHLLGALMESIRTQAIPRWWMLEGIAFRTRLLFIRGAKQWLPVLLALLLLGALIEFLRENPARYEEALEAIAMLLRFELPKSAAQGGSLAALLAATVGPILVVGRAVVAFGVTPSRVAALFDPAWRIGAETSFRQRFARAFGEVVEALRPNRMVIFIDDLDRCQPQNAVSVLETINFLVSSADCHVILGMAPQWVVRSVGLGFREVAAEIGDEGKEAEGDAESRARKVRHDFARKYLEKLINIEVPVPPPSDTLYASLFVPPDGVTAARPSPLARGPVVRAVSRYAAVAAAAAVFGLGLLGGPRLLQLLGTGSAPPLVVQGSRAAPTAGGDSSRGPGAPPPAEPSAAASRPADGTVIEGSRAARWLPAALGALLLVIVLGIVRLSTAPRRLERDSEPFKQALHLWRPLVYQATPNPRSIKRFLNRVRYYAMRQRSLGDEAPRSAALLRLLGLGRGDGRDAADGGDTIPEEILVALAAIQHARPNWLDDEALWQDARAFIGRNGAPEELRRRLDELPPAGALASHRAKFLEISGGIYVR